MIEILKCITENRTSKAKSSLSYQVDFSKELSRYKTQEIICKNHPNNITENKFIWKHWQSMHKSYESEGLMNSKK